MISLYQAGFRNVAASLGTAFNQEHVKSIKKNMLIVSYFFMIVMMQVLWQHKEQFLY